MDSQNPDIDPDTDNTLSHLFSNYLHVLGLTEHFPRKLNIRDAMTIRKQSLGNVDNTNQIKELPFLILHKIMMFDARSRANLYTGKMHGISILQHVDGLHPLDTIVALLQCCNNFLTQDILTRLSTCQLAIPFLLPNPYDGSVMYLSWSMREIIQAWRSTDSSGVLVTNECRIVDYPAPIISFYKIGKVLLSKSKIINEVISKSKTDFFFNWDCEGGGSNRYFVNGMAECCWYLPSGKQNVNDFYSDIIMFANFRGDARKHNKQLNFMQEISFMSCVLLQESDVDDETLRMLQKLAESHGGVIIMFADLKHNQKLKDKKLNQQLNGMSIIKLKGKNSAQVIEDVRKAIVNKLNSSSRAHYTTLNKCVKIAKSFGIQVDEDEECIKGKNLAEEVMQRIVSLSSHEAKLKILPLQGPNMWQKWATLDKESYRQVERNTSVDVYCKDMENKKKTVRQNQVQSTINPTTVMEAFLSNLVHYDGNMRLYFLHWLKMLLDDHSRFVLRLLNDAYQQTTADLLKAKAESNQDSDNVLQLKEKLKSQNDQLVNGSFGLEHFFREMGQMYEAKMDIQCRDASSSLQNEVSSFPQIIVDLMSEGFPVELMDGDAAHVPITWILAVLKMLKKQKSKKQRIFVISVLGIQNTGKSTLLNHMFGLHFSVSAGRCTRGAYFQILSFDSELCEEIGCDHILIVDTEGLRAPELQYKQQQNYDNELATFVIGLADLTIINIYGETPGEITNILQTAVHAFIRMKNADMQLSCHFVHQNVTDIMGYRVAKQKFQEWLDLMTSTAAKLEHCEGRFRFFQDVIQFNDEQNVTLFPVLWKGDPPMAPVNPGYSFKAAELKDAIITSVKYNKSWCSFAAFQLRVNTLWHVILWEKHIFSFKNTLEVTAYNELDMKYSQWSWDFQHEMLEWQHEAGNQINNCDISDIDSVVSKCLLELEQDLNNIFLKLSKDLVEFFEKSEISNTLLQWRDHTKIKLSKLCEEHKDKATKHCKMLRWIRESRVKVDNIQKAYHQQLQAQIIHLASHNKKNALTAKKCKEIFNQQWQQWIMDLSQNKKEVEYTTPEYMEVEISKVLEKQYTAQSQLVIQGLKDKPLSRRDSLKLKITNLHLDSTNWTSNVTKPIKSLGRTLMGASTYSQYASVNDEDVHFAKVQTETFLHQVEEWMENRLEGCQDFSSTLVSSLLIYLQDSIDKFNNGKNSFIFTPHYQVDIALTVSGYAYKRFVTKVQQLAYENDPVKTMDQLKPMFFRTFETQFLEASNDITAAENLCNILTKSIEKALLEKVQIHIVNSMKLESFHFRKKIYFKVLVMKDLAAAKDFNLFKEYLSNTEASLKYWSKVYVKRYCEQMKANDNNLFEFARRNVNVVILEITKVIREIDENKVTAGTSIISDEDTDPLENPAEHLHIKEWLQNFRKSAKKIITIDLQEIMDVIGVISIHNLSLFTEQLIKSLNSECEVILSSYQNISASIAKLTSDSAKSPHMVLYNSLIGCKEQCPFCEEQCELTDENHLQSGKPHYTEIHRPMCLGKHTYSKNKQLIFNTCTLSIETNATFRNSDTNQEDHPYKEYKRIYPNWLISNESPKTGPKYWEWFIAKYLTELIEWSDAAPTLLKDLKALGWDDITEEEAIDNLSAAYGLNVDPN